MENEKVLVDRGEYDNLKMVSERSEGLREVYEGAYKDNIRRLDVFRKKLKEKYKESILARINSEILSTTRKWEVKDCVLVLGKSQCLIVQKMLKFNVVTDEIDVSIDSDFNLKLEIWGLPIYVSQEEDMIMVVASLSKVVESTRTK